MRCPNYIKDEAAKAYWQRHAKRLETEGLLTEADVESFALLCEIWGMIRQTDPTKDSPSALRYIALVKQFQALGKQYGFFAKDRKKSNLIEKESDLKKFLKEINDA